MPHLFAEDLPLSSRTPAAVAPKRAAQGAGQDTPIAPMLTAKHFAQTMGAASTFPNIRTDDRPGCHRFRFIPLNNTVEEPLPCAPHQSRFLDLARSTNLALILGESPQNRDAAFEPVHALINIRTDAVAADFPSRSMPPVATEPLRAMSDLQTERRHHRTQTMINPLTRSSTPGGHRQALDNRPHRHPRTPPRAANRYRHAGVAAL